MTLLPKLTAVSAAVSHVGHVREINEDAVCERPDLGLWVVADGMGGHKAGDVASRLIVDTLSKIKPQAELSLMVEFIEHALLDVNKRLITLGTSTQELIGSTVVAFTVVGRHAAYVWAGDSRLYRYRAGEFQQMTTDHSQVERFVELGLLERAAVAAHPQGHLLTRAIGAHTDLRLDVDLCLLQAGDRFLMCSDGLDKHITEAELAAHLAENDASSCADALIALTLARGAIDNVTLCIIDIKANERDN
jgi:serine/threonine protein phosphatase PrpC